MIYVLGGGLDSEYYNSVDIYHPEKDAWTQGPPLSDKRFAVASVSMDNVIYAIGGFGGTEGYLNYCERLDTRAPKWQAISPMISKRGSAASCVLGGEIYIMGGFQGSKCLESVEVYEPRANAWREVASMGYSRAYMGAAALSGSIYVYGGVWNGASPMERMEKFDVVANKWENVVLPQQARKNKEFTSVSGPVFT
mmetsp:Transcript_21777/g.30294  ORF Transcript_21777/g.30294 Transcript_21777/m.30294 type:complete len:195 (+) Transcript_21777:2-586(+)